jgi:hypothetical protein
MTVPATIAHAVQQTQEWLKELRREDGALPEVDAAGVTHLDEPTEQRDVEQFLLGG